MSETDAFSNIEEYSVHWRLFLKQLVDIIIATSRTEAVLLSENRDGMLLDCG
jgi:hypothetical protein